MKFRTPILTVDPVIFDNMGRVLVIKRKYPPYEECWSLPGGIVDEGETTSTAVLRELKEETSLWLKGAILHLTGFYDEPNRDPRGDYVSCAYSGIVQHTANIKARDDAKEVKWLLNWANMDPGHFGFDHHKIITDAWEALSITRQLAGQYGEPDPSILNPPTIRLTPAQRRSLDKLYGGQTGTEWEETYPGLIKRGLMTSEISGETVIYRITKRGKEAISK